VRILESDAVSLGLCFPTFRRNVVFSSSKVGGSQQPSDAGSFETLGNTNPAKQHHIQDLVHQCNYILIFDTSVNIMCRKKQNEDVIPSRTVSNLKVLMQNERK
jgi:hypothetical protein